VRYGFDVSDAHGDEAGGSAAPAAARARVPMLRSLRHRNYQLFFGGQLVSLVGTWMQSVAQSWLVYRLTGSSMLLGLIGFSSQIPIFVLAPIGGAVADRRSRRSILLTTQACAMVLALLLGVLTLSGRIQVAQLFVFSAALGILNAFDIPARQAFVVEMVGPEDLVNAIALNSSIMNGARMVGPAIAGVLVGTIGEGWCFVANGLSFIAVIAGLLAMRLPARATRPRQASALSHIAEGFRFVGRTAPIRALLVLLGVVSLSAMPHVVLMPIFADRILAAGPKGLGVLMGASGAGALLGALALAARRELRGLGTWVAVSCASFGLALIGFAMSRSLWLSAALLVLTGASMMVQMAGCNTLVQSMTPDAVRGRVMAVYTMMFMGMAPIGALLAGSLAERLGPPTTVVAGGVVCVVAAVVFAWRLPQLRTAGRQLIISQPSGDGGAP